MTYRSFSILVWLLVVLVLTGPLPLRAADAPVAGAAPGVVGIDGAPVYRGTQEWTRSVCSGESDPRFGRVLLVGDSISEGYAARVRLSMAGKYYVDNLATSRSVNDPLLAKEILLLVAEHRYTVVHFNNGLHGGELTALAYASGLRALTQLLQQNANGARLLFATSTPVRDAAAPHALATINELVLTRNAAALDVMHELAVPVDDLYPVLVGQPDLTIDGVHQNPAGYDLLAQAVTAAILAPPA